MTNNLTKIARNIDKINLNLGKICAWTALLMVLIQFSVVVLRYVFSIGFIFMQEAIWYLHGILFLIGAGYTLLKDQHVRVDIFYREAKPKTKAIINLIGTIVFLMPVAAATFILSWGYVINAWKVFEGSIEKEGLPLIWAYKTCIWLFAVLVFMQGIAISIRAYQTIMQKNQNNKQKIKI